MTQPAERTAGLDAADLATAYGLTADDWQADVLADAMAEASTGRWLHSRVGLCVPRQNGKNAIVEIRELYGMTVLGERILHTAHEVKTARKAFLRILSFYENPRLYPDLAAMVAPGGIRRTNGQEAIVLKNGGSLEFVARSKGSARGFTADVLVCDEAQDLTDDDLEAQRPVLATSRNPQTWYTGTPPKPDSPRGEVFTRLRTQALEGSSQRLAWLEWSVDGAVDLDDRTVWAAANPGFGIRLDEETVQDERDDLTDDGFARERLGSWSRAATQRVIDHESWKLCADTESQIVSDVAFAVDTNPERSLTSISVAGINTDGYPQVETIVNRAGTDWVVQWLQQRQESWKPRAVVIDEQSPALSLLDDLERAGVKITVTRTRHMVAACGQFYDAVVTGQMRHLNQPLLNTSLAVARKRSVGEAGGWAWNRRDADSDITPLVSATLALWGVSAAGVVKQKKRGSAGRVVVM